MSYYFQNIISLAFEWKEGFHFHKNERGFLISKFFKKNY